MTFNEFSKISSGVATDIDPNDVLEEDFKRFLLYSFDINGPDGAHYQIFKEPHHTKQDVQKAKNYIRQNFDPLSITIINQTNEK